MTTQKIFFNYADSFNDVIDTLAAKRKELRAALALVKQLSGLLPICASCKKIRDDKGYWQQIEAYIRDHSDAEFTHGMCPQCAKRLIERSKG